MISNILRKILSYLSAWYPNKKISIKKDLKLRRLICKKLTKINFDKKNLKKTHIEFNNKIHTLLKSKNIKNFLRYNFIQKMFFLHNRLFIYQELKEIKKSKNWKYFKYLIKEDHIGNPIRYFLYLESSGNRINHGYHLYILEKELNIYIKKEIKSVFEFGGGYGCMARIFSKINKRIKFTCFDTNFVNLLQFYYLKHNKINVGFSKRNNFFLTSDVDNLKNKYDLFLANWSLSETPINYRKKFLNKIKNSKYIFISFQEKFENLNNLEYFKDIRKLLSKKFEIKIIKNQFYRGNWFHKQNHYFLIGKKL